MSSMLKYLATTDIRYHDQAMEKARRVEIYRQQLASETADHQLGASARPVKCLDDGKTFACVAAAARHYGLKKKAVRAAIARGGACANIRFCFIGEAKPIRTGKEKPVVYDGKTYPTLTLAAQHIGFGVSTVSEAISLGRPLPNGRFIQFAHAAVVMGPSTMSRSEQEVRAKAQIKFATRFPLFAGLFDLISPPQGA